MEDQELIALYVRGRDHEAFAKLVERHASLVVSVATRRAGSRDLADDVAQNVFTLLARKAPKLTRHPTISGWLHRTTLYETAKMLESDKRRKKREDAYHQLEENSPKTGADTDWQYILPHLDQALNKLSSRDRDIILLRYYQNKSFREIGMLLSKSEAASRMQNCRALERLAKFLNGKQMRVVAVSALASALEASFSETTLALHHHQWAQHALSVANGGALSAGISVLSSLFTLKWVAVGSGILVIGVLAVLAVLGPFKWNGQNDRQNLKRAAEGGFALQLQRTFAGSDESDYWDEDAHYELIQDWWDRSPFVELDDRPDINLFAKGLQLRDLAIVYAGIEDDEVPRIEDEIQRLWKGSTTLANAHTVVDQQRNDPALGIQAIRITPFDASSMLQEFKHSIESILGLKRSFKLFSIFRNYSYFGSFGRLEVLAQINTQASPEVRYEVRDPFTGGCYRSGKTSVDNFEFHFGELAEPRDNPETRWKPPLPPEESWSHLQFLDDKRTLTTPAAEKLDLSVEEALQAQEHLDRWFASMTATGRKHISELPAPNQETTSFRIGPFPQEAKAVTKDLEESLVKDLGTAKAGALLDLFPFSNYFADRGRYVVEVDFTDGLRGLERDFPLGSFDSDQSMRANYKVLDSATGKEEGSGQASYKIFVERFGDLLEVKEN
jgi:RNA polymerase sigma factor (sigma-70 family)